jgi:hypothetical protein
MITCVATPHESGRRDTLPCDLGRTGVDSGDQKLEYFTCQATVRGIESEPALWYASVRTLRVGCPLRSDRAA